MAIKYADTMIGARDIKKTADYYKKTLKMKVADKGNQSYMTLVDPKSGQRLCIVAEPKMKNAVLSLEAKDLEKAVTTLVRHGGKVSKRWKYPTMVGADCKDPDGHAIVLWQLVRKK